MNHSICRSLLKKIVSWDPNNDETEYEDDEFKSIVLIGPKDFLSESEIEILKTFPIVKTKSRRSVLVDGFAFRKDSTRYGVNVKEGRRTRIRFFDYKVEAIKARIRRAQDARAYRRSRNNEYMSIFRYQCKTGIIIPNGELGYDCTVYCNNNGIEIGTERTYLKGASCSEVNTYPVWVIEKCINQYYS